MGNSLRKMKLKSMTSDSLIGKDTHWPICNDLFTKDTSYGVFNNHIDLCTNRIGQIPTISKKHSSNTAASVNYDQDLSTKLLDLRSKISQNTVHFIEGANLLTVRREHMLEDSIEQFNGFNNRKELKILFEGENKSGLSDAGGLSKEWFTWVSQELLNPDNNIFRQWDADKISYFVDEQSEEQKDNEDKFFFVGLFMAKAIFDKIPINLCLSKAVFKYILGEDGMELEDLINFDRPLYNSLKYINENDIDDGSCGDMYFAHLRKNGVEEELTCGGKEIKVWEANKYQFVWVKIDFVTKEIVEQQLKAIKKGFLSLIDKKWIKNFTSSDLERALWGESNVDVKEWEYNTHYKGGYYSDHEVIRWFWDVLSEYSQDDLIKFLQFWTGTPRLPIGGFKALEGNRGNKSPFTIEFMSFSETAPYPRAHTCFNRLQLPKYKTYKALKENMDYVVQQNQIYGFGLED